MPLIPIALALATFVPDIVKWITGSDDAEAIAGRVVDIAKQVTGKDDPDEAAAAINADPNLALQFQMAVMANRVELQKMYFENLKDERLQSVEDTKSARERDTKFIEKGRQNYRANVMLSLDYLGLIAISLMIAGHFWLRIEESGAALAFLCTIGGALIQNIRTAHDFEFGSSRSSSEKTITPADLVSVAQIGMKNGSGG